MEPIMAELSTLTFSTVTGLQFEDLVCLYREAEPAHLRGLAPPRLKYYMRRSCLSRSEDQRVFFICSVPLTQDMHDPERPHLYDDGYRQLPVGILELEVSPYDPDEMWLKYITVHPDYQRQGIAKRLLAMMVEHMQAHPRLLQRSSASEEGAVKIQAYIDKLLEDTGIRWRQTGR